MQSAPIPGQPENWQIDPSRTWTKVGEFPCAELARLRTQTGGSLWINGAQTFHGRNDRVATEQAHACSDSLRFIAVDDLHLCVFAPSVSFGNPTRRVQAWFTFADSEYRLRVTDTTVEAGYLARGDGSYTVGHSYLTISLGEPHEGYCYKLVAAVLERRS
jgi:hypothetical protein